MPPLLFLHGEYFKPLFRRCRRILIFRFSFFVFLNELSELNEFSELSELNEFSELSELSELSSHENTTIN